jgi:aconitate hydratase
VVIGSSANPGIRDFWSVAELLEGRQSHPEVSFDVNPTSRQVIENLAANGAFLKLVAAGARFHQAGCMGCIGMGQAPASGKISLRTMPRNFPGRSGTLDDQVYLCSPETAAAAALTGEITDPRELKSTFGISYKRYQEPESEIVSRSNLVPPLPLEEAKKVELQKGSNVSSIPDLAELPDEVEVPAILKMGDNISTDEILKAGAEVLPLRSNIPEISKYTLSVVDDTFYDRAMEAQEAHGGHIVVAGGNYAQGSSREHAALAPRYLGQVAVLAKSYARIGWQNLVNFGIVPLEFENPGDWDKISQGDTLRIENLREGVRSGTIQVDNVTQGMAIPATHRLSERQIDIILAGGEINLFKRPAAV